MNLDNIEWNKDSIKLYVTIFDSYDELMNINPNAYKYILKENLQEELKGYLRKPKPKKTA